MVVGALVNTHSTLRRPNGACLAKPCSLLHPRLIAMNGRRSRGGGGSGGVLQKQSQAQAAHHPSPHCSFCRPAPVFEAVTQWHFTAPVPADCSCELTSHSHRPMPIPSSSAPSPPALRWRLEKEGSEREREKGEEREGLNSNGAADQGLELDGLTRATMLLRRVAADDGSGAGVGRPRLFAVPRLLVGLGAPRCGAPPDCDSPTAARSPTSPLDLRALPFAALGGGSLLRSPRSPRTRSWDTHRLGLGGLVDDDGAALAEPVAGGANNRLLGLGPQAWRQPFKFKPPQRVATQPRDCAHASPELGNVGPAAGAVASPKPVPCSRSYGDVKSGPEVAVPGAAAQPGAASSHPANLGKLFPTPPGSLPASIIGGGPRRYVGSVSAMEVEQSEDYTCIIAHGPNPKTTRIFGDCILEPCTVGGGMDAMEVKEGADSYWLVKCFDDGEPGEEFLSSCVSCNKKLDGNDNCIYRGEKAFCSRNCRDQGVLTEEEENITAVSSLSSAGSSSSFNDDIFMAEMVVLAAPVDVHYS